MLNTIAQSVANFGWIWILVDGKYINNLPVLYLNVVNTPLSCIAIAHKDHWLMIWQLA
jgi:hypothetical protein